MNNILGFILMFCIVAGALIMFITVVCAFETMFGRGSIMNPVEPGSVKKTFEFIHQKKLLFRSTYKIRVLLLLYFITFPFIVILYVFHVIGCYIGVYLSYGIYCMFDCLGKPV